jgi:uncharacterized protein YbaP (TraB family)
MLGMYLIVLAVSSPQDILLQYGALGVLSLILIYAVNKLFQQQVKAHERDIARADRAEEQLKELNKLVREQLIVELTRATDVLGRAIALFSEAPRRDRR